MLLPTKNLKSLKRETLTHDQLQGDSGGSIDYKDPSTNQYYAIGVVSWGEECAKANSPGVYTNVVNYLDWIKSTTGIKFR